jgi:hypothetical protein
LQFINNNNPWTITTVPIPPTTTTNPSAVSTCEAERSLGLKTEPTSLHPILQTFVKGGLIMTTKTLRLQVHHQMPKAPPIDKDHPLRIWESHLTLLAVKLQTQTHLRGTHRGKARDITMAMSRTRVKERPPYELQE